VVRSSGDDAVDGQGERRQEHQRFHTARNDFKNSECEARGGLHSSSAHCQFRRAVRAP